MIPISSTNFYEQNCHGTLKVALKLRSDRTFNLKADENQISGYTLALL